MCQGEKEIIWKPLISDPETLAKYAYMLGVESKILFQDVYSTEEWALELIDGELISIILLFPLTETLTKRRECYNDPKNNKILSPSDPGVWFMKQYVQNSCGAVALIHSILNAKQIKVREGSFIHEISSINGIDENIPIERGLFLKKNNNIEQMHEEITSCDRSCLNGPYEVDHHYVSFVLKNDHIFELDGRLSIPVNHGSCRKEDFLRHTFDIIKEKFIDYLDESENVAITVLIEDK
ncbi:ubiquitin C-terminal hydrolase of the cysteine fold [Cryptosporidium bovis]|uniref:ubiquitin C-terminal hydrolase of the cysteine fold n=1 Tax=Cryptosporidium bovis TaxID=310047 RepID=UPI003519F1D0|nr:ubiquitin C-terminal hydrolase of the cysteine fold [Cryptosporidium bovis]